MSVLLKITNKTEVPVEYALYESPKLDNKPTKNGVLKPGETKEWDEWQVTIGDYFVMGITTGDGENHDWTKTNNSSPDFPGSLEMKNTYDDNGGFEKWHEGNLDRDDFRAMTDGEITGTFGEGFCSSVCPSFSWAGTNTRHVEFIGGPVFLKDDASNLWKIARPDSEHAAQDFLVYRSA